MSVKPENNQHPLLHESQLRFVRLWTLPDITNAGMDAEATQLDATHLFNEVVGRYSEPQRHYHRFAHIEHCLEQSNLVVDIVPNRVAVELAIWFHDVIYDPSAQDNERRSADWFVAKAHGCLSEQAIEDVDRLIMATVHAYMPEREDEAYLVDIDLSSFGLPWARFREDSQAVREESGHLSNTDFSLVQRRFLKRLLDRPAIYSTEFFRDRYESIARQNISKYLDEL